MKIALTIVCSLLLLLGQAVSAPVVVSGGAAADCGCGGKMACCQPAPEAPPAATVPAGSQNQIVSPVPAVVVWVLTTAGTPSISPTVSPSLTAGVAPIFARNCSRLI